MKYKRVERMLRQDFEEAKANHDFCEMSDDYELLRELWATGELDSEKYHDNLEPIVHCFVEVKNNKIELPMLYKSCKQNIGKKVIYNLEEDSIKLIMDNVDDDKIFGYFEEEGKETKYIILEESVALDDASMRTLELHNGDIVELCIDEGMIVVNCKVKCNTCLCDL